MDGYIERALDINRHESKTEMSSLELEKMYRTYYRNVYNYIRFRIVRRCDAEDLACAVFENAIRKYASFRPERAPIEAWLIGIARNIVTDYFRSGIKRQADDLSSVTAPAPKAGEPEEMLMRNEDSRALISAMSRLKDKERQVLSLKFATDLKNTDIARVMGISESNAGVLIHRAVGKLKKIMEEDSHEHGKRQ